ncbi:unnamed protein product [Anisakis simplex]|uniref:Homeobox domain-containing protein n=1 Tax=Anisakis simplex TaxID=6269 RepID=A0A0M3KAV4_ANISI|nr:unnamed protein product [Anisakis simplex]
MNECLVSREDSKKKFQVKDLLYYDHLVISNDLFSAYDKVKIWFQNRRMKHKKETKGEIGAGNESEESNDEPLPP